MMQRCGSWAVKRQLLDRVFSHVELLAGVVIAGLVLLKVGMPIDEKVVCLALLASFIGRRFIPPSVTGTKVKRYLEDGQPGDESTERSTIDPPPAAALLPLLLLLQ